MKQTKLKSAQIKEIISAKLNILFEAEGFTYNKSMNEFRCKKGDFVYIFNLLQTSWSDHHSLNVRLGLSQKRIEKVLEKIIGKLPHLYTFWAEIGTIFKSPDRRQIINGNLIILILCDEDVEAAIDSLEGFYNTIAKPYFERYHNLISIDDILNNPPFDHCPADVGGNFDNRCMKGLITARLVDNPNYKDLVNIYNEEIKGTMNLESIENYEKVRDYLMYNKI